MNKIRAIQALNKKEIEQGISSDASWHTDYRDTAFIYFGGLPFELTEGDVITIFSQFGEPVFLKLARDKETGKSRGFGWLKYEDQRSTDLAVNNLGGAEIGGRLISVDHARYKPRDDEDQDQFRVGWEDMKRKQGQQHVFDRESSQEEEQEDRPVLPEELELSKLIRNHDDDDPMKAYLVEEKRREVDEARRKADKERRHKNRLQRPRRPRHEEEGEDTRPRASSRNESSRERDDRDKDRDKRRPRDRDGSRNHESRRRDHDSRRKLPDEDDRNRGNRRRRDHSDSRNHELSRRRSDEDGTGREHRRHQDGDPRDHERNHRRRDSREHPWRWKQPDEDDRDRNSRGRRDREDSRDRKRLRRRPDDDDDGDRDRRQR